MPFPWYSNLTPVAQFRLTTSLMTKASLNATPTYNIEVMTAYSPTAANFLGENYSLWPIPDINLSEPPQPAEIAEYADYSARPQGLWHFIWGFSVMPAWVFSVWMFHLGFYSFNTGSGYFYDSGVWSLSTVTTQTLDTLSGWAPTSTAGEHDNYRCFQGTLKRPVPGIHYKKGPGGSLLNVLWRFEGLTEITS